MDKIVATDQELIPLREYQFIELSLTGKAEKGYFMRQIGDYALFLVERSKLGSEDRMSILYSKCEEIRGYSVPVSQTTFKFSKKLAVISFERKKYQIELGKEKLLRIPDELLLHGDVISELYSAKTLRQANIGQRASDPCKEIKIKVCAVIPSYNHTVFDCLTKKEQDQYSGSIVERIKKDRITDGPVVNEINRHEVSEYSKYNYVSLKDLISHRVMIDLDNLSTPNLNLSFIGLNSAETKPILKILEAFKPQLDEYMLYSPFTSNEVLVSAKIEVIKVGATKQIFFPEYTESLDTPIFTITHITKIHPSLGKSYLEVSYPRKTVNFQHSVRRNEINELKDQAEFTFPLAENQAFMFKGEKFAKFKLFKEGKAEKGLIVTTLWVFDTDSKHVSDQDSRLITSSCEAFKLPFRATRFIHEMCYGVNKIFV